MQTDIQSVRDLITGAALSAIVQRAILTRFDDLPKNLVNAVLSAEDKRFFEHGGFDVIRILGAAYADVRRGQIY